MGETSRDGETKRRYTTKRRRGETSTPDETPETGGGISEGMESLHETAADRNPRSGRKDRKDIVSGGCREGLSPPFLDPQAEAHGPSWHPNPFRRGKKPYPPLRHFPCISWQRGVYDVFLFLAGVLVGTVSPLGEIS
jgi:hypothetical protein